MWPLQCFIATIMVHHGHSQNCCPKKAKANHKGSAMVLLHSGQYSNVCIRVLSGAVVIEVRQNRSVF